MLPLPQDPALWLMSVAVYGLRALIALALLPPFASHLVPGMVRGALALAIVLPVVWSRILEPAPLDVTSLGLLLLALRDTSLMGLLLAVHLGVVMALFLTLPYGKFAHGVFRSAALLKWSIEKRQANSLQLGSD